MGKLTLILGGARSGKSAFAERLAAKLGERVVYIATAEAKDDEMIARIKAHKAQRPSHWQTLEIRQYIGQRLQEEPPEADVVLLDCITLLVTNVLLADDPDLDNLDEVAAQIAVEKEIESVVTEVSQSSAHWIIVSNEVGLGLVPLYPLGRIYRDILGRANQQIAACADVVYFMLAGMPMCLQVTPP